MVRKLFILSGLLLFAHSVLHYFPLLCYAASAATILKSDTAAASSKRPCHSTFLIPSALNHTRKT